MVHKWNSIDFEIILRLIRGEIHLRQLSKEISTPHSTLFRRLSFLRKQYMIDYKPEGRNKIFFLKKNLISQKAVFIAENYKCIKTLAKYPLLMPIFQEIIEKNKDNLILLFGSYAKSIPKEDSDIDIYIETTDTKLKDSISKINELISVKIGKFDKESLLIQEIIKNHIIIQGVERFYEKLGFFK